MKKYLIALFLFSFYWAGNTFFVSSTAYAEQHCFGGLGLEITKHDDHIFIISTIDDSPAKKAGLKKDDKILSIDHEPVQGKMLREVVEKLRGEIGSSVWLTLFRTSENSTLNQELIRDKICFED